MVYKKYVTRKGKRHGPYYYESVRQPNGTIKAVYLGTELPTKRKIAKKRSVALRSSERRSVGASERGTHFKLLKTSHKLSFSIHPKFLILFAVVILLSFGAYFGLEYYNYDSGLGPTGFTAIPLSEQSFDAEILEKTVNIYQSQPEVSKPVEWIQRVKVPAGEKAISDLAPDGVVIESVDLVGPKVTGMLATKDAELEYDIKFLTPAPQKQETVPLVVDNLLVKQVTVSSDAPVHYYNTLSSTDIPEERSYSFELFKLQGQWSSIQKNVRIYSLSNGQRSEVTKDPDYNVKLVDTDLNGETDTLQWTVPRLSEEEFEIEVEIIVLNVQSYPDLGGNWTVPFNTTGTEFLNITKDEVTFNDVSFVHLKCGDEFIDPVIQGPSVVVDNWNCDNQIAEIEHIVNIAGDHEQHFQFGTAEDFAHNAFPCFLNANCADCVAELGCNWCDEVPPTGLCEVVGTLDLCNDVCGGFGGTCVGSCGGGTDTCTKTTDEVLQEDHINCTTFTVETEVTVASNGFNIAATGDTDVSGTLIVNGTSTLASATVTVALGGTLFLNNTATLNFTDAEGSGFAVASAGTLNISGTEGTPVRIQTNSTTLPPINYWQFAGNTMTIIANSSNFSFFDVMDTGIININNSYFENSSADSVYIGALDGVIGFANNTIKGAQANGLDLSKTVTIFDNITILNSSSPDVNLAAGGIIAEFNNSQFEGVTNVGFAVISANHNDTANDYHIWATTSLPLTKSLITNDFIASDNVFLDSGIFVIDETADCLNLTVDLASGGPTDNSPINITGEKTLSVYGNLTLHNANISIENGTIANTTLNGTTFTLNATNVTVFSVGTLNATYASYNNTSTYVNITNTTPSGTAILLNISYANASVTPDDESGLALYHYTNSTSSWSSISDSLTSGVNTSDKKVWVTGVTEFSTFGPFGDPCNVVGHTTLTGDLNCVALMIMSTSASLDTAGYDVQVGDTISAYGNLNVTGGSAVNVGGTASVYASGGTTNTTLNISGGSSFTTCILDGDASTLVQIDGASTLKFSDSTTCLSDAGILSNADFELNITGSEGSMATITTNASGVPANAYWNFEAVSLTVNAEYVNLSYYDTAMIGNLNINNSNFENAETAGLTFLAAILGTSNFNNNNINHSGTVGISDLVGYTIFNNTTIYDSGSVDVSFAPLGGSANMQFNNSEFSSVDVVFAGAGDSGGLVSMNHNDTAFDFYIWGPVSPDSLPVDFMETAPTPLDNIYVRTGVFDINGATSCSNMTVYAGTGLAPPTTLTISGGNILTMTGNLTLHNANVTLGATTGTIKDAVLNGTNFTMTGTIIDISHYGTALPATFGSVSNFSNFVNFTNTVGVAGNPNVTLLNISYLDSDVQMGEPNLTIFRYNTTNWEIQNSTVNTTNNWLYVDSGITAFSPFGGFSNNSVPTHSAANLTSMPTSNNKTNENLTCTNVSTTDSDGDTVTNIFNWYNNGTSIMNLYMPFDSNNNTTTLDYSSRQNTGTVTGAVWYPLGKTGGTYYFDGADDRIEVAYNASLDLGDSSFGFAFWMNHTSVNANDAVISKADGNPVQEGKTGWRVWTRKNGKGIVFHMADGTNNESKNIIDSNCSDDTWHHVALVYDNDNDILYGYYDGALDKVQTAAFNYGLGNNTMGAPDGSNVLRIGLNSFNLLSDYAGHIDDVRIYTRNVTAEQVLQIYDETKNGITTNSTIASNETVSTDVWQCEVTPNDRSDNGTTTNNTDALTVLIEAAANNAPGLPAQWSVDEVLANDSTPITSRRPVLVWNNSTDTDGDALTYELVIDNDADFSSPEVNVSGLDNTTLDNSTNYTSILEADVDDTHAWKVRAWDGTDWGEYTTPWWYEVQSSVTASLAVDGDTATFGDMYSLQTNSTIDFPSIGFFVLSNDGNCDINATITTDDMWDSDPTPTDNFTFQTAVNESGAYEEGTTSWTAIPAVSLVDHIGWLSHNNLSNTSNRANIHLNVTVPDTESSGSKSATVTITVEKS